MNEAIWRTTSTDFWAGSKLWLFIPATFVFIAANLPMLVRHGLAVDEPRRNPAGAGRMSAPIISIQGLSKTYKSGLEALKSVDLDNRERRDLRVARAQRRRQDDADQHRLRHRHASAGRVTVAGHDIGRDYRAARRDDRAGAAGAAHRTFESVIGRRSPSAAACSASRPNPAHIEKVLRDCRSGTSATQDHGAVGRHEAPGDDRQGALPRTRNPVPRRADRRRRRRAAPRHVEAGPRSSARAASPSSSPPIISRRPRRWPTGSA